ncbi:TPA: hypothetical protein VCA30_002584 [Bacillus cereus]|uniref:hypothetical protein n=1 Tax=Bacillus cereus group TaxID=86661 RepID=UPI0018CCFFF2|nr:MULTISPECIES: hypothetical protein [Bacillus cereus group]HEI9568447.1 hypothetical protein [Bacillus cereus]MBG9840111.1 hypothetical protein [Bacillus tropicus]MBG9875719.1 hypothetical protein [Bacillus tropicus]MBG9919732.1 hypothetical protein [Bacillus tropicus]MBJ8351328.1 hypothetical protein [Bacillus mycoides]
MISKEKINTLKELFKEAMLSKKFNQNFNLIFGNNGVIFRPKQNDLNMLCVKTPLTNELQNINPNSKSFELTPEKQKILTNFLCNEGTLTYSISQDIKTYQAIQKHKNLIQHIPKFYEYETQSEYKFIIMDYIEGTHVETTSPSDYKNPHATITLESIYSLFQEKGFYFEDRVEVIFHPNKKTYTIIDLGGLYKHGEDNGSNS